MTQDLQLGYAFSVRNGFGPAYTVPDVQVGESIQQQNSRELHALLSSLTAVEEAAIRQICPLISILRLTNGNIGSRGNTSCVWQKSKLSVVLPNLPQECNYIILKRRNASTDILAETKFKRHKIERCLRLLKATEHDAWGHITICEDRIGAWPEQDDICNVVDGVEIVEEDGVTPANTNQAAGVNIDGDGDDVGPAPLQNDVVATETYEGVLPVDSRTESASGNAELMAAAIENLVGNARADGGGNADNSGANLPQPQFNANQTTATFHHNDVLEVDGFADMNTTKYAWARAFPTLFIPVYTVKNHETGEMGWVIFHDITGWTGPRDKPVNKIQWYEHIMWRSDGRPPAHPTFSLVLYNHKAKNYLHKQGQYLINTSEFDPTTTIEEIKNASNEDTVRKLTQKLLEKALVHSGNFPGTSGYQKATYHEFKAHSFYQQYINHKDIDFFLTGSLAEFHEYYLRILLARYVAQLSPPPPSTLGLDPISILTDDDKFCKAVQRYKNVVTHYLASKAEIWFAFMYNRNYQVDGGNLIHEFAKSRGAIHYHAVCSSGGGQCMNEVAEALKTFSLAISDAMDDLHAFIDQHFDPIEHVDEEGKPWNPKNCYARGAALEQRKNFCLRFEGGQEAWETYSQTVANAQAICSKAVGKALESHFGLHAVHTGNPPDDWLKPGGQAVDGSNYRGTETGMQSSDDVKERRELKKPKHVEENFLFDRNANMCNHCGNHKCSGYCWNEVERVRKFDPEHDQDVPESDRFTRTAPANNETVEYVRFIKYDCRMHFGEKLAFDNSGENNLTRGQERQTKLLLDSDKNGLPKVHAMRNHPRQLQEPYGFAWYNANNDFGLMLKCKCGYELIAEKGTEWYEKYANNLVAAGWSALEQFSGNQVSERYVTGYQCKGNKNSHDFNAVAKELIERYCSRDSNLEKTIRSLMAVCMSEVTKGSSFPNDQAVFLLSGGKMKRCSSESTSKCSVSNVKLSDVTGTSNENGDDGNAVEGEGLGLVEGAEQEGNTDKSFTWKNITKRYKERPDEHSELNLYKWVVFYWKAGGKRTVPQFFGYYDRCSWPPTEEYSKWMLTFYKPWRESIDDVLLPDFETFSEALMSECMKPGFPDSIRSELWRNKRKESPIDMDESGIAGGGDAGIFSPADEGDRQNEVNDEADQAAQVAEAAAQETNLGDEDDNGDMEDAMFNNLRSNVPPGHDWSSNYDGNKTSALSDYAKAYYASENAAVNNNDLSTDDVTLQDFDPAVYTPANAKTEGQKLVLFHHLLTQYNLNGFEAAQAAHEEDPTQNALPVRPPCQHVLIEGLPGVGKSWIIKVIQAINYSIHKSKLAVVASAPTGCAAALIGGSTNARSSFIPTGKAFTKPPSDRTVTNVSEYRATRRRFCSIKTRLYDESSMMGKGDWGWIKHRNEEFRQQGVAVLDSDEQGELVEQEQTQDAGLILPLDVSERPHGGIPYIAVIGDTNQLPPVAKTAVYSTKAPTAGSSDAAGTVAFSDFLEPPDENVAESHVILLNEVLRQTDKDFLRLLDHMRNGSMTREDADLLLGRRMDALQGGEDEKERFKKESLHLVPTWKAASRITFDYLQNDLNAPIAKFTADYSSIRSDGKNCCVKEVSYPNQSALCKDAKVMLLKNFLVEAGLMNGAVGTVYDICYKTELGPYAQGEGVDNKIQYVIVDFPDSTIPESDKFFPDLPRTCIPIPMVEERCERKCCSVQALPLRCCKALSIHKSQGMTVGPDKQFKCLTVHYPTGNTGERSTPGLELVATSRVENLSCLAIGNKTDELSRQLFLKIGKSKAYETRKAYLQDIRERAEASKALLMERIAAVDPNPIVDQRTYEGGCAFLLNWYNNL